MTRKIIAAAFSILFANFVQASKVISADDSDWNNPSTWIGNVVPVKPDTILIRHYVTLSSNLTIEAPTVMIIEKGATVCGDYFMDVLCGAMIINYGNLYLNSAEIRNGFNYNEFYTKESLVFSGCGSSGGSFENLPPDGHMKVWPPVLCKTTETNWLPKTTGIAINNVESFFVNISPNPLNSGYLSVSTKGQFEIAIYDTKGSLYYKSIASDQTFVDVHDYSNGFYFVSLSFSDNKKLFRKVLVAH